MLGLKIKAVFLTKVVTKRQAEFYDVFSKLGI